MKCSRSQFLLLMTGAGRLAPVNLQAQSRGCQVQEHGHPGDNPFSTAIPRVSRVRDPNVVSLDAERQDRPSGLESISPETQHFGKRFDSPAKQPLPKKPISSLPQKICTQSPFPTGIQTPSKGLAPVRGLYSTPDLQDRFSVQPQTILSPSSLPRG